jgi:hypothetical protein
VDDNPGAAACDALIAENKNWRVEKRQNTRSAHYHELLKTR